MSTSFEKEFYLRTSDFDARMELQPASVLDLFQDVAGEHARALGIGRERLEAEGLIWVIVKARYRILKTPAQFDRVRVRTWPLAPRRSLFRREYKVSDTEGSPLVLGSSEWVVIHKERRRLVAVGDIYPMQDFLTEENFADGFPRLHDFSGVGEPFCVTPRFTDLDVNRHVNNTKYANYIMNALHPEEEERISEFCIEYHREVRENMRLSLPLIREDGTVLVKGESEEGDRMFTARITLK